MYRTSLKALEIWKDKNRRKPLVIRGARQVGKSYLVHMFAKKQRFELLEINFEFQEDYAQCFESKDPVQVVTLLELKVLKKIIPGKTLFFLDEVQAAPQIFASLRYFYEKMPGLHIIAAGSLLDFVLEKHSFSMPVGRIEYLHLGPMTFKEFLRATEKLQLLNFMENYQLKQQFPQVAHDELINAFKVFLATGGMPEAVQTYIDTGSLFEVDSVKQSILLTYRDDFNKYGQRINHKTIGRIFQKLPLLAGQKLKYVNLDKDEKIVQIKKVLHLLALARIYYPVYHSSASGIPLRAQVNEKFQKPLFLDVGLLMSACGMSYADIEAEDSVALVNSGAICEQFIGQHLLYRSPEFQEPELFYWCREKRQASSEIDFVFNFGKKIIPVEVKAGKSGTLKSLHVFIKEKKINLGVRYNADMPSCHQTPIALPLTQGSFLLVSLPLYMVEETNRFLSDLDF